MQAIWEDDITFAYLSYFNTLPEITLKFIDKKAPINQWLVEFYQERPTKVISDIPQIKPSDFKYNPQKEFSK